MNKDLYTLLNTVKLVDVLVTTALFALIIGILITQKKRIKDMLECWRKKRNFEDTIIDSINKLKENDLRLQENIDKVWGTMESARDTSKEIQEEMYSDIKEIREEMYSVIKDISTNLKDVTNKLDDIEKKNDLSKQAGLKEKIEKLYRECHEHMVCTDTAFETLKDLIADYERHGGENSFVHSLVQPEMYTWERIKTIPDPNSDHDEDK